MSSLAVPVSGRLPPHEVLKGIVAVALFVQRARAADPAFALSPYRTEHIHRFGHYTLDLGRRPPPLASDVPLLASAR